MLPLRLVEDPEIAPPAAAGVTATAAIADIMFWQAYPKVKSSFGNYTKDAVVDADLSYRVRIRTETCLSVREELSSDAHAKAAAAA